MKLFHRDATGCSAGGKSFPKGEDGSFEVPAEAVAELQAHGFVTDPRLAAAGPDVKLVEDASKSALEAEHAKAELVVVSAERDALQGAHDALLEQVAELQAELEAGTAPDPKKGSKK